MSDAAQARGIRIAKEIVSRSLDVPVIEVAANRGVGLAELKNEIIRVLELPQGSGKRLAWLPASSPYCRSSAALGLSFASEKTSQDECLAMGWQLLSGLRKPHSQPVAMAVEQQRSELKEQGLESLGFEIQARYSWIKQILSHCYYVPPADKLTWVNKAEHLLGHRVWGLVCFILIMALLFQSVFALAGVPMELLDRQISMLGEWAGAVLPAGWFRNLVVQGLVAGVGSVLVFIPQIVILFFLIGLLEDSGYLARAACITDRALRRFGLGGRSFIPLLSCFACAVPGIMATRTIPDFGERLKTILIAPLISCSARLPVYSLLIAAFIPAGFILGVLSQQGLVLLGLYLLGAAAALMVAWVFRTSLLSAEPAIFVMEMPPLRMPSLRTALRSAWDRGVFFLKTAGLVIAGCTVILWFLASYPPGPVKESFAGRVGVAIEPALRPLGFNWEIGVGILASFAAREVFVSTMATVYNVGEEQQTSESLLSALAKRRVEGGFTTATALAVLIFYVFSCQCFSTLAVCRRETGSWRWSALMFVYLTALAYIGALVTYQVTVRLI